MFNDLINFLYILYRYQKEGIIVYLSQKNIMWHTYELKACNLCRKSAFIHLYDKLLYLPKFI